MTLQPRFGAFLFGLTFLGTLTAVSAAMSDTALVSQTSATTPEFDGYDVMALTDRQRMKTDCKINWAKNGKLYCFTTIETKTEFLRAPDTNIDKANDMFAADDLGDVAKAMEKFEAGDAEEYVDKLIKSDAKRNGGIYVVADPVTGTSIPLIYDRIDFTRTLKGYGFFPDVNFHAKDDPQQTYLVDFWVAPKSGKLSVLEVKIYKSPVKDGNRWVMMQRQPKPWWWIPAAEHPGETEQKRSWEVMSSIERYVVSQTAHHDGVLTLKDDKTGENLALEFMDVHQPVRRLKADGRYFACTDFRKKGTKDEYYDIDFWLDSKTGKVSVTNVRVHKVPVRQDDGSFTQIPRYNFDSKSFDQVP